MMCNEWKLIESAPKDGSLIIAFKFGMLPLVVTWLPHSENESKKSEWWFSPLNPKLDLHGLKYWMPLPPPPVVPQET